MANNDEENLDLRRVSPELQQRLNQMLYEEEKVEYSLPADLSLKGNFEMSALYVTNKRLISFDTFHSGGFLEISRDNIVEVNIEEMYGNSIFQVTTLEESIELNRFTNTVSDLFADICEYINKKDDIETNRSEQKSRDQRRQSRCPQCGRVLPKRSKVCPYCVDKRKVLSRLIGYVKPYWKVTALGLLCSLLATAAGLVPPYLTKVLVDKVVLDKNLHFLWIIVVSLLLLYVLQAMFGGFRIYLLRYLAQHIVFDLRKEVFAKIQSLPIEYYDKRSTGAIMSRVSNDTQQLQSFIIQATQDMLVQVLTLLGIGIVMLAMHWQLALLTLLPVPLVTIGSKIFAKRIHPIYHRVWRRRAWMNAILGDSIPGIRVIKAFNGGDREVDRFTQQGNQLLQEQMRAARMASVFNPTISFLVMLGGLIIWGLGGYWVITQPDKLTLGMLIAFIGYMGRFYAPVQFLAGMNDSIQQAATAGERVFEILDSKPEQDYSNGKKLDQVRGELEFRNVSFQYEKGTHVLEDINLKIKPGETIGLVGSTGSGKSTIANLLMKYYEPAEGQILLDGVDIKDVSIHSLRSHIGIVLQEPLLFRDTIANNIAYSKPEASIEEVIRAARVANAHDFIRSLPDAYDTRLGERGIGLSGGERQRISIARAVIKDPDLLVLDEATSAVDTETEKLIQEAIERLIQNRTTIIIAHRLSTLRKADKIVVIEDGHIAEMGTHDELMRKQGKFYRLICMQSDMGTDMLKVV